MNQDSINIAVAQLFDPALIGLLCIFATPIVFGAITAYISQKEQHKVTSEVWKYWEDKRKDQDAG
tara:strand:- start:52 stop:246 length:195 start_codon:yes stop_codon:yes gene_type:complete